MKQSKMTGSYIYRGLKKLYDELQEIENALTVIDDELGKGNIAYTLVKKQQEEKGRELKKLENMEYLVPVESPVAPNPFDF